MANTMPSDLDRPAAQRQTFGAGGDPGQMERSFHSLRSGILSLPPHPDWRSPDLLDWGADPFQDRNWSFQRHTLRWVEPVRNLGLRGDQTAREYWLNVVRSWWRQNVPKESAVSAWAWKDMADGVRAVTLSGGVPLLSDKDEWFVRLLEYHRDYLLDESNIVKKNHAMHQLTGLFVISAVLRDSHGLQVAHRRLTRLFCSVFDEEGSNNEGSIGYHQLNLTWWSKVWKRVELEGLDVPPETASRLNRAAEALAHFTLPNGLLPQVGDTKRVRISTPYSTPELQWVRTTGGAGSPPRDVSRTYRAGYIVSRSGWGEERGEKHSHMLVRFGEDVRAHSHQDRGSVHLYTDGRPWLVDSGFVSYQTTDPYRRFTLSREAHNLAFIEGATYDARAVVELVRGNVDDEYEDYVLADRGYLNAGVELHRRVTFLKSADAWVIQDRATAERSVTLRQQWVVDIGLQARLHDRGYRLTDGMRTAYMHWLGRHRPRLTRNKAQPQAHEGWIATKWKHKEAASMVKASIQGQNPGLAMLFAGSYGATPALITTDVASNGSLVVQLARGERTWTVRIDESDVVVREGPR